ncbi:MAG: DUF4386 domain-containing protein [Chitinophagaceae bacterium]
MHAPISSLNKTVRLTGFLYFLVAIAGIFGYMYVYPKIMVENDIAATGRNMLANESLYRFYIAIAIVSNMLFVTVVLLLQHLLRPVNEVLAKLMAVFILITIPVSFVDEANKFAVLQIFKGNLVLSIPQAQELAALLLKLGDNMGKLCSFLWGLWLIPLAWLVYRSGFLPKFLGVLLLINGLGFIISSMTFILFPAQVAAVDKLIFPTYFLGELPFMLWMMIAGAKRNKD